MTRATHFWAAACVLVVAAKVAYAEPPEGPLQSLAAYHGGDAAAEGLRVYADRWHGADLADRSSVEQRDDPDRLQAGFRADWIRGSDAFTLQGDAYVAEGNLRPDPLRLHGANLLGRWRHGRANGDALRVKAHYDRTARELQRLDTTEVDVQYALARQGAHRMHWGTGLRYARDRIENAAPPALAEADKNRPIGSLYVVDEIALDRSVDASVGAKVERSATTGAEFLPTVRLRWRLAPQQLLWGAGSRAVRSPSRFNREQLQPGQPTWLLAGGPEFRSEVAHVYEIGYRGQLSTNASLSTKAFFHDLDKVRAVGSGADAAQIESNLEGHTRGVEAWGSLRPSTAWRLQAGYTHLQTRLRVKPGQTDPQPAEAIGSDPRYAWHLRLSRDLAVGWELGVLARRHGALDYGDVPVFTAVDLRAGWRTPAWDAELLLQNAFDSGSPESAPAASELQRAAVIKATLRF